MSNPCWAKAISESWSWQQKGPKTLSPEQPWGQDSREDACLSSLLLHPSWAVSILTYAETLPSTSPRSAHHRFLSQLQLLTNKWLHLPKPGRGNKLSTKPQKTPLDHRSDGPKTQRSQPISAGSQKKSTLATTGTGEMLRNLFRSLFVFPESSIPWHKWLQNSLTFCGLNSLDEQPFHDCDYKQVKGDSPTKCSPRRLTI